MRRRGRVRVYIGKDVVGAGWRAQLAAAELIGGREQQFEKKRGKSLTLSVVISALTFICFVFLFEIRHSCMQN